ncbi:MAG: 3-phosphoshikimate 1-carboxyvinyltransferase [Pseudobdellovibrio sp.]
MFHFKGDVILSKSWLNRAQTVKFFNPELQLPALETLSDDVASLKSAIARVNQSQVFDLGQGGTTFRFFVFLISRLRGEFTLKAHSRLFERPQSPLVAALKQLGVYSEIDNNEMRIKSDGWEYDSKIEVAADLSSQFISGLLLSCWNLEKDIEVVVKKPIMSYDYLKMTLDLLRSYGMQIETLNDEKQITFKIVKKQQATKLNLKAEPDVSSLFSLVAAAVVNGEAEVTNWRSDSTQPDMAFLHAFQKMQIKFEIKSQSFKIAKHNIWYALHADLKNSPDLFPVLAVLCALAKGESVLSGAAQLRLKESDRIAKTKELLNLCGYSCEELPDGLKIRGESSTQDLQKEIIFNPDHDHRMAMAAALFKLKGFNIKILHPEVVNKSYPNFWKDLGL